MHYYQHHIGDFNSATRHLTRIERSVYRDLLELYYDTERPLVNDLKYLCRKIIARTEEEATAVEQVLNEFFTETEHGWQHERCELEINRYHSQISSKSAAGKASAAKRAKKTGKNISCCSTAVEQVLNDSDTTVQLTNNHKPITINQEPGTNTHTPTIVSNSNQEQLEPTAAARVCMELKKIGISDLNPAHPKLLMLIESGATVDEFVWAAREAASRGKGFRYALGTVEGQRKEAALAKGKVLEGKIPNKADQLLERNMDVAKNWKPPEMRVKND